MPKLSGKVLLYVVLIVGALIFTIPLIWMVSTALKPIDQAMSSPPRLLAYRQVIEVDGEPLSVSADVPADDATDQTLLPVQMAYQWMIEIDGEQVPVSPIGRVDYSKEDSLITVDVNYHLMVQTPDGELPGRLVDEQASQDSPGEVEVVVIDATGYTTRINVRSDQITKTYDKTKADLDTSFGERESLTVLPGALTKKHVDWEGRGRLAHVFIERSTAPAGSIDTQVAPQWRNFGEAIQAMKLFPTYLNNTLVLCILTVIGTVCSSTLVAYGFSRIDWPGRDKVFVVVLATMMIPAPVLMVPLFTMFRDLGWIGTLKPLWVPSFFAAAFNVFLLRQFFRTIPKDLSESAKIDGCSEFRIFWQIILPLAKPAITVVALFQFLGTWNDFLGPLIYLTEQEDFTLALGLQFFQSKSGGTPWHYLMAASSLVVLPVIVLFFLAQRTFIEGISMSGLKA